MRCLLLATLAVQGCAYAFSYGGASPERLALSVDVEPLVDRTPEGIAGALVTDALLRRLGHPVPGQVTYTVRGEVLAIESGNLPVARPGGVGAGLSEVRVRAAVRLLDGTGREVWHSGERLGRSELPVGASVSETEDARRLALERACAAVADELADALIDR